MVKVMHKILGGMVLMMLLPFVCRAEETNIDALQYVGGTIPIIRRVEVSGPGYADFFSTVMADDYAAGFKASENGATTLTITANKAWKVLVRTMPFTKIEEYVKPASDLHLRIKDKTVVHEGEGNGGTLSETFTDFAPLSEQDQVLWANTTGGDNGCTAKIDFKVLLNAAMDISGTYTTTVTYTICAP
ncbi:MAG: hypothetical protein PF495_20805 [Spirochaetales bacterium]|jgi:hypothetical protein|nr:hypothetical protein [Spirochaetales bacterium]